jgi:hypothetical protein
MGGCEKDYYLSEDSNFYSNGRKILFWILLFLVGYYVAIAYDTREQVLQDEIQKCKAGLNNVGYFKKR